MENANRVHAGLQLKKRMRTLESSERAVVSAWGNTFWRRVH